MERCLLGHSHTLVTARSAHPVDDSDDVIYASAGRLIEAAMGGTGAQPVRKLDRHICEMEPPTFKLIYLTGAPAAGKTTLCNELKKIDRTIDLFEYGSEMSHLLDSDPSLAEMLPNNELRRGTSRWVTQGHIDRLDNQMIAYCAEQRKDSHVIIDSRHVTNEAYGFRSSAFSQEKLRALGLSEIWVLYASPEVLIRRLTERPGVGLNLSIWDLKLQVITIANLAIQYGILAGIPVYMYDTTEEPRHLPGLAYQRLNI
jgi:adenylate kinase